MYSAKVDTRDYAADNAVDVFAFFFAVTFIVEIVAVSIQLRNIKLHYISKKQNIELAIIVGLFQMACLFTFAIRAAELFIETAIIGDGPCRK